MSEQRTTEQENSATESPSFNFRILETYAKDLSFEVPNSPEIFQFQGKLHTNTHTTVRHKPISEQIHEVVLCMKITVKAEEMIAFICEVHYAGIFALEHSTPESLELFVNHFSPQFLIPFVKETIASLTTRGGFPGFMIAQTAPNEPAPEGEKTQ